MSRAFVKEPDGDQVADDQPETPQSPHPNYITQAGALKHKEKLAGLREEHRKLVSDTGDLLNKVRVAQIEREIRFLQGRIERAIVVDPSEQPADKVCFGATIEVEDEHTSVHAFTIVGEDETSAAQGKVSWVSPLAHALLGRSVGDNVTWHRPSGDAELTILSIRYPKT